MVDIIILNPIGTFKVDVDNIIFVLRPIFYLNIYAFSLVGNWFSCKIGDG
jgi:hypothetical protein